MNKIDPINLSPSFLSKVLSKGYDYACGEKLGLLEKKDTDSQTDGKLLHSIIAEQFGAKPEKTAISPYDDFRTKDAKNWRDSQPDDTLIVKQGHYDKLVKIAKRVVNHPHTKKITGGADVQAEIMIEKQVHNFNLKGVVDLIAKKDGTTTVVDWKFISSKKFDAFNKHSKWDNYDLQAAEYDVLTEATHVYFGVIENTSPYRIKYFYCRPSFLEAGAKKFDDALNIIKAEKWREPSFDIMEIEELEDWGY